ncbi:hypothetical protein C8R44DRAFT_771915 [Mycena epipterygia]|nr:hypothetical protein C8R44DRAFT_771915 [Mycena epipterygia]
MLKPGTKFEYSLHREELGWLAPGTSWSVDTAVQSDRLAQFVPRTGRDIGCALSITLLLLPDFSRPTPSSRRPPHTTYLPRAEGHDETTDGKRRRMGRVRHFRGTSFPPRSNSFQAYCTCTLEAGALSSSTAHPPRPSHDVSTRASHPNRTHRRTHHSDEHNGCGAYTACPRTLYIAHIASQLCMCVVYSSNFLQRYARTFRRAGNA